MKLENKVAIVTGAGSGMGKAIAELFAKEGAKVIASDINETGVKELIASSGDIAGEIVFSQTDVSNRSQVEAMIDLAVNKYGKLDVLVNNAGVLDKMYSVTEVEDEFWERKAKCDLLKKYFLSLRERVADVFLRLSKAYVLPIETEE